MGTRTGISLKIAGIVFLVSSVFVSILVYMNVEEQKSFFEKAYVDKAVILAKSLDSGIESREELNNREMLLVKINKLIWENPEILKMSINLPDSETLKVAVSSDAGAVGASASPQNYRSYQNDITYHEISEKGSIRTMTVTTPIHLSGTRAGTYEMVISTSSIDEAIALQGKKLIILAAADFLVFILFLLFLLDRSLVKPIKELISGAEIISKGNLDYKAAIKSDDELGRLASAFNRMTEDLKSSQTELKKRYAGLEEKVQERTTELNEKVKELERFNKLAIGRELKMVELKKRVRELEGKK